MGNKIVNLDALDKIAKELRRKSLVDINQQEEEIEKVRDMFDGKSFRYVSQAEYDMLSDEEKNDLRIVWSITDAEEPASKEYVDNAIAEASIGGEIDTSEFALKSELPTKTSQLTNDSGFMTSIPDEYVTNSELEQTLIPFGQELDKKSNILNYSDHTLNGVETYNNFEKLGASEISEIEAIYIINKPINLTKGSICSIEVKFSDNTNLLLQGEVMSSVLIQKEVNHIQTMNQTTSSMGIMLMDKVKYSIGDDDSLIPEHNDNASTLVVIHPNANNVISLTITKPTTFEINNSFFMDYQFVNDAEKENWNNKADKTEIPSIEGLASEDYVDNNIKTVSDELAKQMDQNVSGSLANGIIQAFDAISTDRGRLNNHDAKIAHFESQFSIINGEGVGSIKKAVSDLVDAAPTTLDTLNELAQALGNDPNFATTISTEIGKKINTTDAIQSQFCAADDTDNDIEFHVLMKNNKLISPISESKYVFWHGETSVEHALDLFNSLIEQKADKSELEGLATEVYVNQSISQASEDLQNQINELFQNVSSGKELIASAITDKGVDASEEETFQSLSEKINQIPVGPPGSNIIGYVNENNDIYVSLTELESGTYTLKFEDYTGLLNEFDDIGTVEV